MKRQRRADTKPELALRRILHARGLRYRVDFRVIPSIRARGDIVFTRAEVAVFVHGCFWHSCPEHGSLPKHNREWWQAKLQANTDRDMRTRLAIEAAGWRHLRFWEHEDPEACADTVIRTLAEQSAEDGG